MRMPNQRHYSLTLIIGTKMDFPKEGHTKSKKASGLTNQAHPQPVAAVVERNQRTKMTDDIERRRNTGCCGATHCYDHCSASVGLIIGYFLYQIFTRRYEWEQAADQAYFSVAGIWTMYLINRLTR